MYQEIVDAVTSQILTLKTVLDEIMEKQNDIENELNLTRKGHEAWSWGDEVEDSEDIELEEINALNS